MPSAPHLSVQGGELAEHAPYIGEVLDGDRRQLRLRLERLGRQHPTADGFAEAVVDQPAQMPAGGLVETGEGLGVA